MFIQRQSAAVLRQQVEHSLARRVPGALSPVPRLEPARIACGEATLDSALRGGLPLGTIAELVGSECSGRSTAALAYTAAFIQQGKVAAWIDVSDMLDPESAAMSSVDWTRLLWVRCGPGHTDPSVQTVQQSPPPAASCTTAPSTQPVTRPAPQGSGSPHPRSEGQGMDHAIQELLAAQPRSGAGAYRRARKIIGTPGAPNRPLTRPPDCEEQVATDRLPPRRGEHLSRLPAAPYHAIPASVVRTGQPSQPADHAPSHHAERPSERRSIPRSRWTPLDQALRAGDLLLQSGGFGLIVLDLGSTPAAMSLRIPLATWFRFRAACERTQTSLLLLTREPCARSSAALVVRMNGGRPESRDRVLTGFAFHATVERDRLTPSAAAFDKVVCIRKPPQSERQGDWKARAAWA